MQLQPPSNNGILPYSVRFKEAGAGPLKVTPSPSPLESLTTCTARQLYYKSELLTPPSNKKLPVKARDWLRVPSAEPAAGCRGCRISRRRRGREDLKPDARACLLSQITAGLFQTAALLGSQRDEASSGRGSRTARGPNSRIRASARSCRLSQRRNTHATRNTRCLHRNETTCIPKASLSLP